MKISNIELFTDDILDIINTQEYIGIRMSGGIDSSILCHIILRYLPDVSVMPIVFYNKLRPAAINSVNNVFRVLNELNPNNKLMQPEIGIFDTTGYVRIDDYEGPKRHPKDVFQRQFIRELFGRHAGKLNFIVSGATMNPPLEDQAALGMLDQFNKDRNGLCSSGMLSKYFTDGVQRFEYSPFRNYNKRDIAGLCKELGLLDTLFPVTETCETEPHKYTAPLLRDRFGMTYTRPGVEPCQCCWPCREKYWAYGVFDFNTPLRAPDLL